ncbi:proline dehydrogenase family protein [Leptospira sp. 201903070]|uniref:Proline dehydrogenase family protein n=1 Tax=Leptospira ainlahdjerensis TaxID=2810033 RepID=A0ABS2U9D4_9LEPT|nr:proline dehydrogenase family protein [Leptospira ainlahdjerensis]MBM9575852.1 proline dehydrogenase family protein [Leptospira ainlahdjerensis]
MIAGSSEENIELKTQTLGMRILKEDESHSSRFFSEHFWSKTFLKLSLRYPKLKVEMFRFVDVLPSLRTKKEITEHFVLYLINKDTEISNWVRPFLRNVLSAFPISYFFGMMIRAAVLRTSGNFIAGINFEDAKTRLQNLRKEESVFTLDVLGEAALSEKEAVAYQKQYLDILKSLDSFAGSESTRYGTCPFVNVSVKCSSLYSQISSLATEESVSALKERLRPILRLAKEKNYFINLDAEQFDYKEILLSLAEEIFSEPEFAAYPHFGIVIQTYLKNSQKDLIRILEYSKNRNTPITVRLVKGAYWEYEVIRSREKGWETPVFENKEETDFNYETCAKMLLDSYPRILSAFASHNIRSLSAILAYAEIKEIPKRDFEIQMLYGMGNSYKFVFKRMGYRIREYTPLGEFLPGMAYLVRRLLENTSNQGFLQNFITGRMDYSRLLKNPEESIHAKLS